MLFEDEYKTIAEKTTGTFKDRGSKFLAFAYPVSTEDEVKKIILETRKEFHDACHHCYAYRIGYEKLIWRANDDGEPSGTAGKPIFNQILSKDLTNILIIVVRYFGGTLLGVPGLINAYKAASIDALMHATIISKTVNEVYEIFYDYPVMNEVMKILKDKGLEIISTDFSMQCKITFRVRKNDSLSIYDLLKKISSLKINYLLTD